MSKYEELQNVIQDYGRAAFSNLCAGKAFARKILNGAPDYFGCPPEKVKAVPPAGEFNPNQDYGDAAFSFYKRPVVVLEPVVFGMALTVDNPHDDGAVWLRVRIAVEVSGDQFEVFVGAQPRLMVNINDVQDRVRVYDEIYKELLGTFKNDVEEFHNLTMRDGIGFVISEETRAALQAQIAASIDDDDDAS